MFASSLSWTGESEPSHSLRVISFDLFWFVLMGMEHHVGVGVDDGMGKFYGEWAE